MKNINRILQFIALCCLSFIVNSSAFAQCDPTLICEGEPVSVSASGFTTTAGYSQWYGLLDQSTGLFVAANTTGDFTNDVSTGVLYSLHALNFNAADIPSAIAGTSASELIGLAPTDISDGCFNADFETDNLCFIVNPAQTTCLGNSASITSSGAESSNTQWYFLVDDSGVIVDANSTGVFTTSVAGDYFLHALNFDPVDAPTGIPNTGDPTSLIGQALGSINDGCYNEDLEYDRLCLSVTDPGPPPPTACYETAILDGSGSNCIWVVSGTPPTEPSPIACYETNTFDAVSCTWSTSGDQPLEPSPIACYETNTFDTTTCSWSTSGTQPALSLIHI